MMEKETIYGQVIAKANNYQAVPDKATGGRRIIKNEKLREYERCFIKQCTVYKGRLISSRFKLHISVYHSSMRYDLDNSLKTILDLLQTVKAITNDNLCVYIIAEKRIDRNNPRVTFAIEECEPTLL